MRKYFVGVKRGAAMLALLVVVLTTPALFADEYQPEPPEARIRPPVGLQSYEPSVVGAFVEWMLLYSGISIPFV